MNDLGFALRNELRAERALLIDAFLGGGSVELLLRGLTRAVDVFVRHIAGKSDIGRFATIIAIGGYGRGELFPHSDVDVLIVHRPSLADDQRVHIEQLIGLLWDLGLHVGHAVRTVDECAQEARADPTVLTSMLESRLVIGPRALYREFSAAIVDVIDRQAFFQAKRAEQQLRHVKYENSPYSLEPNCKESPGGLRDLQVLLWIARAAGLGTTWGDLQRRGLLTADETNLLRRTERTLKRIRAHLHIASGRREDRLVFDVQTVLAAALHIEATAGKRASEAMMQTYYRAAKAVTQLNTVALLGFDERLSATEPGEAEPLDAVFHVRRELLDIDDDAALAREPRAILRAFLVSQQNPNIKGMSPRLLRAIWRARDHIDGAFRRDPVNRATFLAILQQKRGVIRQLRQMNQWSVLGRYLPVFRRIIGQMQHDLFHVYTVDQHIIMVIRNLRRFTQAEHAHEYPLCSQLIADFDAPWILYVAALFHDIAKGRGGDHSELGMHDARRFCRDHGLSADDRELVAFLVEHHLTMSKVAQKQDIADPAVIARFAKLVGSDRRLVALYLLTVADIRGTSPKVWNAWKGRLLEELFKTTRRALGGEVPSANAELDGRKRAALRVLQLYGLSADAHRALWDQLDVVYFLRHSERDIAWHTRTLLVHLNTEVPIVRTRLAQAGVGVEVLIYVKDHRDLFARVCGYFDSRQISILDAKIHTTRHGYALDTFVVADRAGARHFRDLLNRIETELAGWIAAAGDWPTPSTGRLSRQSRHFPVAPAVGLEPDEGGRNYLLSVTATDRIGLLYGIARVLMKHQITVQTAKILTLGERVEDVFRIEGEALNSPREQLQLEADLLAVMAT